jgi:hypothetical protein
MRFGLAKLPPKPYFTAMPRLKTSILLLVSLLLVATTRSQALYKTPSGKKYHLATCHMVKNVSEKISPEKALEIGLEPCKICKPVIKSNNFSSAADNKAQGKSKTVQCSGITKAGTRCKHRTSIANGYCYQHQPG